MRSRRAPSPLVTVPSTRLERLPPGRGDAGEAAASHRGERETGQRAVEFPVAGSAARAAPRTLTSRRSYAVLLLEGHPDCRQLVARRVAMPGDIPRVATAADGLSRSS